MDNKKPKSKIKYRLFYKNVWVLAKTLINVENVIFIT